MANLYNYDKNVVQSAAKDQVVTTTTNGLMIAADKVKLDGIGSGANKYTHPSTHSATMITTDASHRFVSDSQISAWNAKLDGTHKQAYTAAECDEYYSDDGLLGVSPAAVKKAFGIFPPKSHKQAYTSTECTSYGSDEDTMGVTPAAVKKAFNIFSATPKTHDHSEYYTSLIARPAGSVLAAPGGSNGGATFRKIILHGTAAPSGGQDGDIYVQY